jgi:hypothetical protein
MTTSPDQEQLSSPPLELPEDFSHMDLYEAFAETPYGRKLAGEIRFAGYKPEHLDKAGWVELLGDDVDNLRHMSLSMRQTADFLDECARVANEQIDDVPPEARFYSEDCRLLLVTAAIHDWAEAIHGDIQYHDKTAADEAREASAFEVMIEELLPEDQYPGFASETAGLVANILADRTSKLGRAFNAIERQGYTETGLLAYQIAYNPEVDHVLRAHAAVLTRDVLSNQLPYLMTYAESYPATAGFLSRNGRTISEACILLSPEMRLRSVSSPDGVEEEFPRVRDQFLAKYRLDRGLPSP